MSGCDSAAPVPKRETPRARQRSGVMVSKVCAYADEI